MDENQTHGKTKASSINATETQEKIGCTKDNGQDDDTHR